MRIIIIGTAVLLFFANGCSKGPEPAAKKEIADTEVRQSQEAYYGCGAEEEGHCPHCDEGKPDAQCVCGGHSFITKTNKQMTCPVCKKPLKEIAMKDMEKKPSAQRKILHYRNPMNPNITSDVPAKDSMGMDFIPVYEEETAQPQDEKTFSKVRLSPEQIELAGVKTEAVTKRHLFKLINAVGKVAFDPELAVAQEEFITALETRQKVGASPDPDVIKRADTLVEKSKFKLRLLGMSDEEIRDLEKEGAAQMNLVLPGDKAWVYAEIYEYELGWVKAGQDVSITAQAYPDEKFDGVIKSIKPVISPATRSAGIRIETDNIDNKLKPEMYVNVVIESMYVNSDGSHMTPAVPKDAVLDTGARKVVYVDSGEGMYIGKEVELGPEASADVEGQEQKYYPVISGLKEGDIVVTKSNFLIDSESQLGGGMSATYGGSLTQQEENKPPAHIGH